MFFSPDCFVASLFAITAWKWLALNYGNKIQSGAKLGVYVGSDTLPMGNDRKGFPLSNDLVAI